MVEDLNTVNSYYRMNLPSPTPYKLLDLCVFIYVRESKFDMNMFQHVAVSINDQPPVTTLNHSPQNMLCFASQISHLFDDNLSLLIGHYRYLARMQLGLFLSVRSDILTSLSQARTGI